MPHDALNIPSDQFSRVWELPRSEARQGRRALAWCTDPDGELAVLLVHEHHLERTRHLTWTRWWATAPFPGEILTVTGQGVARTSFESAPAGTYRLTLLSNGRFVLSSGTTHRPEPVGPWEPNAMLFTASGSPTTRFCLGMDVKSLIADRHDRLWTTHGDQGIFGDHPESRTGTAAWDTQGRSLWTGARSDRPVPMVEGLVAATEGEHVWLGWQAGPLPSGPERGVRDTYLTRVDTRTGATKSYLSPVSVPDGLAVRGDRAVLIRHEHDEPVLTLTHAELAGDMWTVSGQSGAHVPVWTVSSELRLNVPGGVTVDCGEGRDGALYVRLDDTWIAFHA